MSKIVHKDARKCKNRQNHDFVEVAVMGVNNSQHRYFVSWRKYFKSLFLTTEKIYFIKSDGLTLGTPEGTAFHTIFSGMIFCVKRPQLSETAKIRAIIQGF